MAERHAYYLPDGRFIDFDLPEPLRLAIGDAVVAYSRIDNMVLEIMWELRGSSLNEKRKLVAGARRRIAKS